MEEDPILAEIHRIREEIIEEFDYDLDKLIEYLRQREAEHPERVVSFPPRRPASVTIESDK